jgi:hypothetical protein
VNIDQRPQQERRMKFTEDQMAQLEHVVQAALTGVNLQLQNGEKRMDGFAIDIATLAEKQETNNVKTNAMYETFDTAKKGLVLLGTIGGGLKWVAGIVAAIAATWAVMKGKQP